MDANDKKRLLKSLEREKRRNYTILYTTVVIVWIVLVFISFLLGYFSVDELIVNIINNIIGILPPILIFDFFNEKLSRDSSAIEMSNKITETLMSNPETLELFTKEQRGNFINSVVGSIIKDEDAAEMVNKCVDHHLSTLPMSKIRTEFDYNIELGEKLPLIYEEVLVNPSNYLYVQEKLHYRIKYLANEANNLRTNTASIGFMFTNQALDNMLREKDQAIFSNCIFRESLEVYPEDVEKIREWSEDMNQFQQIFKIDLQIDGCKGVLKSVDVHNEGMICNFDVGHNVALMEHIVRIIFHMPKKWNTALEVAVVDPTKAPKIFVSYPEDTMTVEMYPFLSKGKESSIEVAHEHLNGVYDIAINNEWIYPISGMVFFIFKK